MRASVQQRQQQDHGAKSAQSCSGPRRQRPHQAGAAATRLHNRPLWKQSAERKAPTKGRGTYSREKVRMISVLWLCSSHFPRVLLKALA